jgi:hypothetical protein
MNHNEATISPEQILTNLAKLVLEKTEPSRVNIGKRPNNYTASKSEIAEVSNQLAQSVIDYLAGELKPIAAELPF